MSTLAEGFPKYFEVLPAMTEEAVNEALQLRYQVYCLETGFERSEAFPDGMEKDEFDDRSVHSLLVHRPSGMTAGTVRLVLPDQGAPATPFPIESHTGASLAEVGWGPDRPERAGLAEISRFCISKEFKRRMAEAHTPWGSPDTVRDEDSRRLIPHITVGLFAGIVRMTAEHKVQHWCAVMEPSLLRLLRRFAVRFGAFGKPVQFRGLRQPCHAGVDEVLTAMRQECPEVWDLITDGGRWWIPPPAATSLEVERSLS